MDGGGEPAAPQVAADPAKRDRRRRRRWLLVAAAVVAVLAATVIWVPRWMLGRAEGEFERCREELHMDAGDRPASCRDRAARWLRVPAVVPGHRARARALADRIDYWMAAADLDIAAVRDIDTERRDRDARRMLDGRGAREIDRDGAMSRIARAGAYSVVVSSADAATSELDRMEILRAALWLGDPGRAGEMASNMPSEGDDPAATALRSLVLCLSGQHAAGIAALRRADQQSSVGMRDFRDRVRLALVACGARGVQPGFEPTEVSAYGRLEMDALLADLGRGSYVGPPLKHPLGPALIPALLAELDAGQPDVDRILALIRVDDGDTLLRPLSRVRDASRWNLDGDRLVHSLVRSTTALERAAARARALAAAHDSQADLLWVAATFEMHAASEHLFRGSRELARQALIRARHDLDGGGRQAGGDRTGTALITLVHAIDGPRAALDLAATIAVDSMRGDHRAALLRARALALPGAGRFQEAHQAALQALEPADDDRLSRPSEPEPATRWLEAALALRAGKTPARAGAEADREGISTLAEWLQLAQTPATDQAERRWRERSLQAPVLGELDEVLPAVLYLVGRAADGADVEAWLDIAAGYVTPSPGYAESRAEAARWRGDAAAAREWDRRAAALRALARDPATAHLLALLAGI